MTNLVVQMFVLAVGKAVGCGDPTKEDPWPAINIGYGSGGAAARARTIVPLRTILLLRRGVAQWQSVDRVVCRCRGAAFVVTIGLVTNMASTDAG
uniref:Putative secreted protein n=1 Tax=Anopheles marajoara TaxID=58244 RepID=A0A2M4C9E7_9DIPT